MIVEWQNGSIAIDDEQIVAASDDATRAVFEGVLREPADMLTGELDDAGTITEGTVRLRPGEPGHARAAVHRLAGARIVTDDGADLTEA